MPEYPIVIHPVDFSEADDVNAYLDQLDAYARDLMGAGQPLPAVVRSRLVADLAAHPSAYCLLARHAGNAVGFATCFLGYSTFRARPLLNIHDLAVLREWRGRSVARSLLDAIAEIGHRLDCCKITLEVREDNSRARLVYEDAGFTAAQCSQFMEKAL